MSRVRMLAESDSHLHHVYMSFCLSVCLSVLSLSTQNNSASTGKILMEFGNQGVLKNLLKKQIWLKSENNNVHITGRLMHICDNTSLNFSQNTKCFGQSLQRKSNAHLSSVNLFCESYVFYEIMWKNMVLPGRLQVQI